MRLLPLLLVLAKAIYVVADADPEANPEAVADPLAELEEWRDEAPVEKRDELAVEKRAASSCPSCPAVLQSAVAPFANSPLAKEFCARYANGTINQSPSCQNFGNLLMKNAQLFCCCLWPGNGTAPGTTSPPPANNGTNSTQPTPPKNGTNTITPTNGTNSTTPSPPKNGTNTTTPTNGTNSTQPIPPKNGTNTTAPTNGTNSTTPAPPKNGTSTTTPTNGTNSTTPAPPKNSTNTTTPTNGTNSTTPSNGTNSTNATEQVPPTPPIIIVPSNGTSNGTITGRALQGARNLFRRMWRAWSGEPIPSGSPITLVDGVPVDVTEEVVVQPAEPEPEVLRPMPKGVGRVGGGATIRNRKLALSLESEGVIIHLEIPDISA